MSTWPAGNGLRNNGNSLDITSLSVGFSDEHRRSQSFGIAIILGTLENDSGPVQLAMGVLYDLQFDCSPNLVPTPPERRFSRLSRRPDEILPCEVHITEPRGSAIALAGCTPCVRHESQ